MFGHAGQDVSVYVEADNPICVEADVLQLQRDNGGHDVVGFVPTH